ncbi:MAG TPA: rRNA maturation RNase YbeY [Nocardioidaceae bacterium]|nr:rRNA maturation RNase YbeY [Nocardioidaceae bacterium]
MSVEVLNESGADVDVTEFARLSRFVMGRMRVHPEAELCVKLVDEDTMAEFNKRYMGKDGPTDVLSFPMDELRPAREGDVEEEGILGDMLLCPQYAAAQAPSFSRSADDEMRLLTIHGILHLLGYDHAEPDEELEMFGLQARLLAEWQGVRSGETVE